MKNAVILHGTGGSSSENWFPWLKKELEKKGFKVWVPDLPGADKPDVRVYNSFLLDNWEFNKDTVLIGHSSGAVSILGLLNKFKYDQKINKAILVAGFKDNLGWKSLNNLFDFSFDWKKIKAKANSFIFVHSDDDPYVPVDHGVYLRSKLGGELLIYPSEKHFSVSTGGKKYKKLHLILELLK